MKGMQAQGLEWGEGYRSLGRQAIAGILPGQMGHAIDEHLDRMARARPGRPAQWLVIGGIC